MKDTHKKDCPTACCMPQAAVPETPGQVIDIADDEKVSEKRVDEYTKSLNNNPRNDAQ